MTEILLLARKDLKLLLRDRAGFFFTFFWPVIMAMFFGSVFGGGQSSGPSAIALIVVDQDQTEASERLISVLDGASEVRVIPGDVETAASNVRRGAVAAYLVVPEGFEAANRNRFVGGAPLVELRSDPSRIAEAGLLEGVLIRSGSVLLQDTFTDRAQMESMVDDNLLAIEAGPDFAERAQLQGFLEALKRLNDTGLVMPEGGTSAGGESAGGGLTPLTVDRRDVEIERAPRRPKNPYAVSFAQAMLWAVIGCSASFGISLAIERSQGTLVRLRMSPLRGSSILAGKGVACFVTAYSVSLFLVFLAVVVFGVRPLSWPLLLMALTCTALCFVGIMMLLSVLGRTERAAAGIGWAILLVMSMFGGGMVPLFVMPDWMKALSDFSPVKWGILAIEGAVWRGFGPLEMVLPCSILLAVGLVTFVIGSRLFQWGELG